MKGFNLSNYVRCYRCTCNYNINNNCNKGTITINLKKECADYEDE